MSHCSAIVGYYIFACCVIVQMWHDYIQNTQISGVGVLRSSIIAFNFIGLLYQAVHKTVATVE